jgi:UDP-N-acetylbacillosamine N-acetyltransferase
MNKNLLILCDSAYGTVAKEIALSMGCFEKVDVLNQHFGVPEAEGEYHEISVGKLEDYENFAGTYSYAVATFEDSQTRLAWSDKLIEAGFAIISLISPKSYVSPSAQINQGCIIEPLAGVSSNVSVGACSIIKMGALINHNSVVAEGCCCESYSIIKTGAYVEPHRVVEMRRTVESYEEALRIRQEYN